MANNREYDYALKLVLIGNAKSEKSALSLRYVEDIYNDNLEPLKGFAEFVSIIIYIYIYIIIKLFLETKNHRNYRKKSEITDMGYSRRKKP